MLGIYNYTVLLTYLGMAIAYAGITVASHGNIRIALLCLMLSGFCDMFDGKIASTKKDRTAQERRFGIQIDSLSDLICFGVLPGVIVYRVGGESTTALCISAAYVLCALIRLAWFNVDEEERQGQTNQARVYYQGLPVTSAALLLPLLLGLALLLHRSIQILAPLLLVCMGVAFLTPFRLTKPRLFGKIVILLFGAAALAILLVGGAK